MQIEKIFFLNNKYIPKANTLAMQTFQEQITAMIEELIGNSVSDELRSSIMDKWRNEYENRLVIEEVKSISPLKRFFEEQEPLLESEYTDKKELKKAITEKWKSLSADEKKKYKSSTKIIKKKEPMEAFDFYLEENMTQMIEENKKAGIPASDVRVLALLSWKQMNDEDRMPYFEKAESKKSEEKPKKKKDDNSEKPKKKKDDSEKPKKTEKSKKKDSETNPNEKLIKDSKDKFEVIKISADKVVRNIISKDDVEQFSISLVYRGIEKEMGLSPEFLNQYKSEIRDKMLALINKIQDEEEGEESDKEEENKTEKQIKESADKFAFLKEYISKSIRKFYDNDNYQVKLSTILADVESSLEISPNFLQPYATLLKPNVISLLADIQDEYEDEQEEEEEDSDSDNEQISKMAVNELYEDDDDE